MTNVMTSTYASATGGSPLRHRSNPILPILVLLLVALTVGLAGWMYYQGTRKRMEQAAWESLSIVANLKVEQILTWQHERMKDAYIAMRSPINRDYVKAFMADSSSPALRATLELWMQNRREGGGYSSVLLCDLQGNVRLAVGSAERELDAVDRTNVVAVAQTDQIVTPFEHLSATTRRVHMGFYVPLQAVQDSGPSPCVGVLILEIDPYTRLFPMIQRWPSPSQTAETSLVQQDGDQVVYLNELRNQKDTSLRLRFPLATPSLPAAMAARGQEGDVRGIDYRGIPVLAVLKRVSDTPWYITCEIDQAEVTAPLRNVALAVVVFSTASVLVAGLALLLWWKRQETRFYRQKMEMDQARLQQAAVIEDQRQFLSLILEETLAGYWDWDVLTT